ncbi:MAG: prepilin-type N-terminal cleavage/methylation domain-containing protein [Bacteroidota bacterium]
MKEHPNMDKGYTLIETLVAMAIFVSVLIPLGATIGNFILDRSAETMQKALHCAETGMSRIVAEQDFMASRIENDKDGFIVQNQVDESGNTADITVSVSSVRRPEKVLVTLHKTVLVYSNAK